MNNVEPVEGEKEQSIYIFTFNFYFLTYYEVWVGFRVIAAFQIRRENLPRGNNIILFQKLSVPPPPPPPLSRITIFRSVTPWNSILFFTTPGIPHHFFLKPPLEFSRYSFFKTPGISVIFNSTVRYGTH